MARARRLGVPAPAPWHVDAAASTITMEAVAGRTLRDALRGGELGEEGEGWWGARKLGVGGAAQGWRGWAGGGGPRPAATRASRARHSAGHASTPTTLPATARAMTAVGAAVAALHDGGLVHGDLTTSNLILRDGDDSLVVIDFGLATHSTSAEDRGVDLYVLERALMSAHAGAGEAAFGQVVAAYRQHSRHWAETLRKFADVRLRGRKRSMVG